jgi:hypothetical protein
MESYNKQFYGILSDIMAANAAAFSIMSQGARYPTGENLEVAWAEFSTTS